MTAPRLCTKCGRPMNERAAGTEHNACAEPWGTVERLPFDVTLTPGRFGQTIVKDAPKKDGEP